MTGGDFRVREFTRSVVTLRPDLVLTPRSDQGDAGYLLEDRVNSRFFRIGVPEYTFIALLRGDVTVGQAVSQAAQLQPDECVTEDQAVTICRWLLDNQLATTAESVQTAGLKESDAEEQAKQERSRWNPLFLRLPLMRPDALLSRMLPWTGWLFAWPMTVLALMVVVLAGGELLMNWERFLESSRGVFSSVRWLWLGLMWIGMKILHEFAHGIVCKRYGGSAREAGVVLIMGAPIAYIDVTSAWRFRSKWQRIHTAAAGIYTELVTAAVAVLIWSRLETGVVSDLCFQLFMLAGAGSLLFNANPLMRFDGYYVLTDLLDLPNLAVESQQLLRALCRRVYLGLPTPITAHWGRRLIYFCYGVAAGVWRLLVCVAVVVAAASLFRGAGIVLAAVALGMWVVPGTLKAAKYLAIGTPWEQPRRMRLALTLGGTVLSLIVVAMVLPWPGTYRAPVIAAYAPLTVVRAGTAGFVREVRVSVGDWVNRGQVLAVLENEELDLEVAELQIQVRRSENRRKMLRYDGEAADSQAEAVRLEALRHRLAEREVQRDSLVVRAPLAGTVTSGTLSALVGRFLPAGSELLAIGQEDHKELEITVAQEDLEFFHDHLSRECWVRIHGEAGFPAQLASVAPRASDFPSNPGFCAPLGGPLPVHVVPGDRDDQGESRFRLVSPRFEGVLRLTAEQSRGLRAGQRGIVSLFARDHSIADHFAARIRSWLKTQLASAPRL